MAITPEQALNWATVALQLVALGVTTVGRIRQHAVDAGWAEDDVRLQALDTEYARRIAVRKAEAAGLGSE